MKFLLTAPLLLAALGVNVLADKDTDFYYSGFTNPNVKKKMYWKDAYNVLEDLDQFSALYITYHNCAHSLYPTPNGSDEDEDNEGYDYWYSYGAIPKFRANAAYSLYGILKSDGGSSSSDACHKGTYINSFFTNRGVETLTYPFGIGNGETSQCGAEMNGNGDEDGGRFLSGDGGDGGSYGLGCYDGQFVYGQYSAGDCMGYIESVSDTMDDLNAALESLECIQIYDENGMGDDAYVEDAYGDDAYGDDAYNDDGGRMLSGDGNGDYYQAYEDSEKLDILLYSEACRIDLYGSTCPDPYGQKQGYESALNRALKNRPTVESGRGKMAIEIASAVLFLLGAVLFGSAFAIRKRAGARTIQDTDDALMTPEKMEKQPSLAESIASSASKKAQELKEKFQDFAEEEASDEEDTTTSEVNAPEVNIVDTPERTRSVPPSPAAEPASVDDAYVAPESPAVIPAPVDDAYVAPESPAVSPAPASPESIPTAATSASAAAPAAVAVTTPTALAPTTTKMKKKRPMLNKISKTLFGKKKKEESSYVSLKQKSSSSSSEI